jgi:hypothetical protein
MSSTLIVADACCKYHLLQPLGSLQSLPTIVLSDSGCAGCRPSPVSRFFKTGVANARIVAYISGQPGSFTTTSAAGHVTAQVSIVCHAEYLIGAYGRYRMYVQFAWVITALCYQFLYRHCHGTEHRDQ